MKNLVFIAPMCNWQLPGRSVKTGCNCYSRIFECSVVVSNNSAPMNLGVTILIQEVFEHRESLAVLTPKIWGPVVGFNFKTVKKLFTNKVSMYLWNVQSILQVLVNLLCMSNIHEGTELSHIPASLWEEKTCGKQSMNMKLHQREQIRGNVGCSWFNMFPPQTIWFEFSFHRFMQ